MLESTFQTVVEATTDGERPIKPETKIIEANDTYGKFAIGPLERGFGITLGSSMRRVLLSSIPGTAITWIRITDVLHEYTTIPGVKEEVMEFLLNVKALRIRSMADRRGKMRLDVSGEGEVCAGDIATSADFEIINPELHLASLTSADAVLSVELNVEQGKGYRPATESDSLPIDALPVDAIFNPVRRVDYAVEHTRVGQRTDYERLLLEVWTDGSTSPVDASEQAGQILVDHFFLLTRLSQPVEEGIPTLARAIPPDIYQMPLEKLGLSPRTLNCLKRGQLTKVGQVLETGKDGLMKIRNFGEKSLQELYSALRAHDLLPEEEEEETEQTGTAEEEGEQVPQ